MTRANRRDRWKQGVQRDRTVPAPVRLFLIGTLAPRMTAQGIISCPRRRLAETAGVTERQVARYTSLARERGWLTVVSPGYRTMTAVYQAVFPDAKGGHEDVTHSEPERVTRSDTLCGGHEDVTHSAGERVTHSTSHQVGTYVPTGKTARGDKSAAPRDGDDDYEGGSLIKSGRSAPTTDEMAEEIHSSSKASRHLRAVPA